VSVAQAELGLNYTALLEALVIDWPHDASVSGVSRLGKGFQSSLLVANCAQTQDITRFSPGMFTETDPSTKRSGDPTTTHLPTSAAVAYFFKRKTLLPRE
jgi:hypothetical protein